jgi:hypothetical protein
MELAKIAMQITPRIMMAPATRIHHSTPYFFPIPVKRPISCAIACVGEYFIFSWLTLSVSGLLELNE